MNSGVQLNFEIVLTIFSAEGSIEQAVFAIDPITGNVGTLTNTTSSKSLKVLV